jgi:hypothetical protein
MTGVGESLGVIAGAGADDPFGQLVGGETDHHIIGASELVGPDYLEVFSFEEDAAVVFA